MRVAIIGHIPYDNYTLADGSTYTGFGGIFYGASALSELVKPGGSVVFISRIGDNTLSRVSAVASSFGMKLNIDAVPGDGWTVNAVYVNGEERREHLTGGVPAWTADELIPLVEGCEGVILNMVTGYEMELPEFVTFASHVPFLHLDFHSLALGRDHAGLRYPRLNSDAVDWCRHADIVQMNRKELESVFPGIDPKSAVKAISDWGPQWVAATEGSSGVYLAAGNTVWHLPADNPTETPVDPTGCGDAFGAGLLVGALHGKSILDAAIDAQRLARRNADFKNIPPVGAYAGFVTDGGRHR